MLVMKLSIFSCRGQLMYRASVLSSVYGTRNRKRAIDGTDDSTSSGKKKEAATDGARKVSQVKMQARGLVAHPWSP